jgi:hypothetical protein
VTNVIERLATAVYREACANAEQRLPKTGGLSKVVCPEPRTARPARRSQSWFHFYQHLPRAGGVREAFDCIALRFEDDEYRDPRWFGYPVIPELIQSARFDIARDASPSDAKGYRLPVGGDPRGKGPFPTVVSPAAISAQARAAKRGVPE